MKNFIKFRSPIFKLAMVSSSPTSLYFGLGLERLWRVLVTRGPVM